MGSVINPLSFMVLETFQQEMLYVVDLVIIAECGRTWIKKFGMEKQHQEQWSESQYREDNDNKDWNKWRACIYIR